MNTKHAQKTYQNEIERLVYFQAILQDSSLSKEELSGHFKQLIKESQQVLKKTVAITNIGDINQKKLHEASKEIDHMNQALIEANQLKDELLNMAVHDLRNPMTVAMGYAEMVGEMYGHESGLMDMVQNIRGSLTRMLDSVNDLLKVQELDNHEFTLDLSEFKAHGLLDEVVDKFQIRALSKGQNIQLEMEKTQIMADRMRLTEILENLISNAIKYSPRNSDIYIRLIDKESIVRFEVEDFGPGISVEDQKLLYGKFQRLSALPTGGETSTGLGLSIVKQLVLAHDGHIAIESEIGKGTVFIVEIPKTMDFSEK